jgi:hypothetical protein
MKKKTLLAIFATGMVLGVGAAACGGAASATQTENEETVSAEVTDSASDSEEADNTDDLENSTSDTAENVVNASTDTTSIGAVTSVSDLDFSSMFTDRDSDYSYDESSSGKINLNGSSAECSDSNVSIDGTTVTITAEGTYIVSGTLDDGQIIVDAGDNDKVQIVLDGASITNDDSACIYIRNADKVFLTLADGSDNTLSDTGAEYVQEDTDTTVDGVIFSKDDITINGSGTLNINASYANGIVGKDDVKFTGGTINVTATANAIEGKDSVRIKDGTFKLVSGSEKDGIHSSNEEEAGKGYICIEGGDFEIAAKDDGIHAATVLYIAGGNINVTESYEGLEGDTIDITGGTISVVASDDGLNASTSTSQDEPGFGNMGGGMDYDENAYIHIYGGELYVNTAGDGLDSNGDLYVDGGYVVVDGPENDGNGPLDKGGSAYISGGTVIAVGSSGMAETFSSDSEQYSVLYGFETTLSAGDVITITDSTGTELLSYTLNKTAASIVFSSPELTEGEYTITAGDTTDTITVSDKATTAGQTGGMMGGPGGGPGNGGERPQMQDGERPEMPDGEMPQMQNGERPEMPNGEMPLQDGEAPQMPNGEAPQAPDGGNSSESGSTEG